MQNASAASNPPPLAEADRLRLLHDDLAALAALLSPEGPYLLGAAPCFADAALYGTLDCALYDAAPNTLVADAVARHPALVRYAARLRAMHYPEERVPGQAQVQAPAPAPATEEVAAALAQCGLGAGDEAAASVVAVAAKGE